MITTVTFHTNPGKVISIHNLRDEDLINGENMKNDRNFIDMYNLHGDSFFEIISHMELKEAYEILFGDAINKYNAKQKRADRRIDVDDYMTSVENDTRGKRQTKKVNGKKVPDYDKPVGKRLTYEAIIKIGNCERDENGNMPEKLPREIEYRAIKKYCEGFQNRNPNLFVTNIVIHGDEMFQKRDGTYEYAAIHAHIEFIPYADEYKQGLCRQNSISKALKSMGYVREIKDGEFINPYVVWENAEQKRVEEILKEVYDEYCDAHPEYKAANGELEIHHPVHDRIKNGDKTKEQYAAEQE